MGKGSGGTRTRGIVSNSNRGINPVDSEQAVQYWTMYGQSYNHDMLTGNLSEFGQNVINRLMQYESDTQYDTLYRGIVNVNALLKQNNANSLDDLVGKTVKEKGFLPTTSSEDGFEFMNTDNIFKAKVVFSNAKTTRSVDIEKVASTSKVFDAYGEGSQQEILVSRGARYKVERISYDDDYIPVLYARFVKK